VLLAGIPRAADEHVELYPRGDEHLVRACRGDELPRGPRLPDRLFVAGREVHGVRIAELVPGQRVVAVRPHPLADHRDRPLGNCVDVHEGAALGLRPPGGLDTNAELLELPRRSVPELVVAERRQEEALAGEARELDRRDGASARRLLPGLEGMHDLARRGYMVHARELDPFDVADDRYL